MLVGLNGAGKTTSAAKLALTLRKLGQRPLLVACDTYRPAAVNQLVTLGKQIGDEVYEEGTQPSPGGDRQAVARSTGASTATPSPSIDTAGRLQIDERLMGELVQIKEADPAAPRCCLVANAMTGQEAVSVAEQFNAQVGLTGLILTQMDGDARGGAALSIRAVTGVPIKFLGMGEKIEPLQTVLSRPPGLPHPGHGRHADADRADPGALRPGGSGAAAEEAGARASSPWTTSWASCSRCARWAPSAQVLDMIPGMNQLNRRPEFAQPLTTSSSSGWRPSSSP